MTTTVTADRSLRPIWRQGLNVVAYVLVITVNALANALPINGITSGAVSDRFPTFVTPAGYVFAIWGVIYALLAVFTVYQALPAQREDPRLRRLGVAFAISCVLNAAWLFSWHHLRIPLAWVLIVALLISLIVSYERVHDPHASRANRLAVQLPFSVYLGWVTVATVANTGVLGLDAGLDGGVAAPAWGVVALAGATAIGLAMLVRRNDIAFALVGVWALIGIAVAQADRSALVGVVAVLAAAILAGGVAVTIARSVRATA